MSHSCDNAVAGLAVQTLVFFPCCLRRERRTTWVLFCPTVCAKCSGPIFVNFDRCPLFSCEHFWTVLTRFGRCLANSRQLWSIRTTPTEETRTSSQINPDIPGKDRTTQSEKQVLTKDTQKKFNKIIHKEKKINVETLCY